MCISSGLKKKEFQIIATARHICTQHQAVLEDVHGHLPVTASMQRVAEGWALTLELGESIGP